LLDWVENGGILIGYNIKNLRACEIDESYQNILFNDDSMPKKIGKGVSFFISIKVDLVEGIKKIIPVIQPLIIPLMEDIEHYQRSLFDPMTEFLRSQGYYVTYGVLNEIYAAWVDEHIMLLNAQDSDTEVEITLPNGEKKKVKQEYNSIKEVYLDK